MFLRPHQLTLLLKRISQLNLTRLCSTQNTSYGLEKKWAYYDQKAIDKEASKPLRLVTPTQLMFVGKSKDGSHLIKSGQFLQEELPRRIARRVKDFQGLPYVVAINPVLQEVYELYLRAFHKLSIFPKITTGEQEVEYSTILRQLLDDHQDVVTSLAQSFHQMKGQVPYEMLGALAERTLTSRLGIRLLAEHHIGIRQERPGYVGIVCLSMSLKSIVEKCVYTCKKMCEATYGYSPAVFISGHTKSRFPHIPAPVEYILQELIKNSMKATVIKHKDKRSDIPPVEITICNNDSHFMLRISDHGGGVPDDKMSEIFRYSFSTTKKENDEKYLQGDGGAFDGFLEAANAKSFGGSLSGYGFGLPSANAYAKFLGGSLTFVSMYGLGTNVFLKLAHIAENESVKI